jgi:F0F1-type ATP synthase beta subunit
VRVAETIRSFKEILDGKHDTAEQAFYMVGHRGSARQAEKMKT